MTLLALYSLFSVVQVVGKVLATPNWLILAEQTLLLIIYIIVNYGNFTYMSARLGYLKRLKFHSPASREDLLPLFSSDSPTVTTLIPSYKEETDQIEQALLSVALQSYPHLFYGIVKLIGLKESLLNLFKLKTVAPPVSHPQQSFGEDDLALDLNES